MAAEAATGRTPERLITPAIPDCFDRHLHIWLELHARRQVGMAGLLPISWPDLAAYCAVTRERLTRQDLHALNVIEQEFFESRTEAQKRTESAASRKGALEGTHAGKPRGRSR